MKAWGLARPPFQDSGSLLSARDGGRGRGTRGRVESHLLTCSPTNGICPSPRLAPGTRAVCAGTYRSTIAGCHLEEILQSSKFRRSFIGIWGGVLINTILPPWGSYLKIGMASYEAPKRESRQLGKAPNSPVHRLAQLSSIVRAIEIPGRCYGSLLDIPPAYPYGFGSLSALHRSPCSSRFW